MSEPIKVVFFDVDETLCVKSKKLVPASVAPALRQLKANGIIPAIATGRSLCALPDPIYQLIVQEGIELFVTINGQFNRYQNRTISKHPLSLEEIERCTQFFDQHGIDYAFVGEYDVAVSKVTPALDDALRPITERYFIDRDYYQKYDVYQLLVFYDESKDAFVEQSGILGDYLKAVRWHPFAVDVLDSRGSKARGIAEVMQHLGYTSANAMAFGDGLNDVEMFGAVGVSVAMGNAHPAVKPLADFITRDIEDDGVYHGLKHFGLID